MQDKDTDRIIRVIKYGFCLPTESKRCSLSLLYLSAHAASQPERAMFWVLSERLARLKGPVMSPSTSFSPSDLYHLLTGRVPIQNVPYKTPVRCKHARKRPTLWDNLISFSESERDIASKGLKVSEPLGKGEPRQQFILRHPTWPSKKVSFLPDCFCIATFLHSIPSSLSLECHAKNTSYIKCRCALFTS